MMIRLLAFSFALTSVVIAHADVNRINYGAPFTKATEKEAKAFVVIGMGQKAVFDKFGPANMKQVGDSGMEVWQYFVDTQRNRVTQSDYYGGFEMFFKNRKVTYLGIIRGRNSN